jgi:hypothetical protein
MKKNYEKIKKMVKIIERMDLGNVYGYLINEQYEVWSDGICYNRNGKDLPQYIFELKDLLF